MYSSELSLKEIKTGAKQLIEYKTHYEKRFKSENLSYIDKMITILQKFEKFLSNQEQFLSDRKRNLYTNEKGENVSIIPVERFETAAGIDGINMHPLLEYVESRELPRKLRGFISKRNEGVLEAGTSFEKVVAFLKAVSNDVSRLGRVSVCHKGNVDGKKDLGYLKFWLLDASSQLLDLVDRARSVILLGGTMKPFDHFLDLLFPSISRNRFELFSCGHIINSQQVKAVTVKKGPTEKIFDFSYSNRRNKEMIKDLAYSFLNLAGNVPHGVIAFFQSFSFLEYVLKVWKEANLYSKISHRKKIFCETKISNCSENVFERYSDFVLNEGGAMLFCVFGGKLSEGIDFKDDLARCVVCVGVPFPNIKDPELREKMAYFDRRGKNAGNKYYKNLCMRSVNQSIGRAIRWKKDYAFILMLDKRYSDDSSICDEISGWIRENMTKAEKFGRCVKHLKMFFNEFPSKLNS